MGCARPRRPVARLSFLLVSVLLSVAPQTARAQQLGSSFPVEERQTAVVRVVPGAFVRARLTDGSRTGGPLVGATPVAFTLGPSVAYSDNQSVVRLVNVDSLWVRAYSSRRGAMIGGGVGGLLGLDRPATGVGSRVPSLRDRLPAELRAAPAPAFDALPFTSLYLLDDEFAAEVANQTVHGVLHLGRVPDEPGRDRVQMAILVKPNGLLGEAYMAAIRPFRYLLVYPPLLRELAALWRARAMAAGRRSSS